MMREGDVLAISEPRNNFPLRRDANRTILLAGGIGITPLLAMAQALHRMGLAFELHCFAQSCDHVAFRDVLHGLGESVVRHLDLSPDETVGEIRRLVAEHETVLRDAHAILVYLAAKYDPSGLWYPTGDAELIGETAQWMLFAEGTTNTASAARLCVNLGYDFDLEACQAGAHRLFRVLDEHLWSREREGRDWVCSGAHPTIADIALFPDVMLSEEGGIPRINYPALRRWTDRVRRIPGFETMPGIFPASPG